MSDSFVTLIEQLNLCNEKLYFEAGQFSFDKLGDENIWQQSVEQIAERGQILTKLNQITPKLNDAEINVLAQVYQQMLENDKKCLAIAEQEYTQTRTSLRKIKNAAKAVPAYTANIKNSYR